MQTDFSLKITCTSASNDVDFRQVSDNQPETTLSGEDGVRISYGFPNQSVTLINKA